MPGPTEIVDLAGDVKPYLNIEAGDTSRDTLLATYISGATFWANRFFGNVVQVAVGPETHDGGDTTIIVREPPIIDGTLTVKEIIGGVVWDLTEQPVGSWVDQFGYSVDDPVNGIVTRRTLNSWAYPFAPGNGNVIVSYTSGRATVPGDIKLAVLEDIRGLWQQTQQGGRGAFMPPGVGGDDWKNPPLSLFPRLAALAKSAVRAPVIA